MRILGIDPGFAIVGYGVIDSEKGKSSVVDYGVITTPKEEKLPARLHMIYDDLAALIDKFKPDCMAIEELFFTKNITTGIAVAEARGVILLCATHKLGHIFEYTPNQIKEALTGYGKAAKAQMQFMVTRLLGLKSVPKPDDAADALAVALTQAQTGRLAGIFRV